MKVMLIGAAGMLGYDLARVLKRHDLMLVDLNIEGMDTAKCDITNLVALKKLFEMFRPSYVINASAYTDVDACEDNIDLAYKVNSDGVRNLAVCSKEYAAAFLHVSTDYVYDGTNTKPYVESDRVNPLGVYGKSKLDGERQAAKVMKDPFIVRTALLYGKNRTNFVTKILDQAKLGKIITVPDDMTGSPTYSLELARQIEKLLFTGKPGLYHTANQGYCSRYEWAKKLCSLAGIKAEIKPIKTVTLTSKAPRPLYSALRNNNLDQTIGNSMKHWEEALEEYIKNDL